MNSVSLHEEPEMNDFDDKRFLHKEVFQPAQGNFLDQEHIRTHVKTSSKKLSVCELTKLEILDASP